MQPHTYIALLRAINVGGHTVTMERLRSLFAELGLANVRSYIQTGNVFFDTDEADRGALAARIEGHLKSSLGYEVPVMLRTVGELGRAMESHPFEGMEVTEDMRLCVVFLASPVQTVPKLPLVSPKGDMEILSVHGDTVFVLYRIIDGKVGNLAAYVEKLGWGKATVRFYHTTLKILTAATV